MQQLVDQIRQVASSSLTILIQGETGTGKELVARSIHEMSARRDRAFIALDCGAIPDSLIESEFFGYEKGAFTGAEHRKDGQLQLAEGGSFFLDEIANLSTSTQAKLLRMLQERKVQPLGGQSHPIDVRFIAATHDVLDDQVAAGRFRQDLYYRLAEFSIHVPPLRERQEDIVFLARRFQEEGCLDLERRVSRISDAAADLLLAHRWPGNVRELRNVIRQAVVQADGPVIDVEDIRPLIRQSTMRVSDSHTAPIALGSSLKEITQSAVVRIETQVILEALRATHGNKSAAAKLLEIDYTTLLAKIKRYGLIRDRHPN